MYADNEHNLIHLFRQAVVAINGAAHAFRNEQRARETARRLRANKTDLVSIALELDLDGVRVAWQRQNVGHPLLTVTFAETACVHVPFERLSISARLRVVEKIGPAPALLRPTPPSLQAKL